VVGPEKKKKDSLHEVELAKSGRGRKPILLLHRRREEGRGGGRKRKSCICETCRASRPRRKKEREVTTCSCAKERRRGGGHWITRGGRENHRSCTLKSLNGKEDGYLFLYLVQGKEGGKKKKRAIRIRSKGRRWKKEKGKALSNLSFPSLPREGGGRERSLRDRVERRG